MDKFDIHKWQRDANTLLKEGWEDVDDAVSEVLKLVDKHANRLNDDEAVQFHDRLKDYFNRVV